MAGFAPEVLDLLTKLKAGAGGVGEIDALAGVGNGVQFFVDWEKGSDANDGLSWAKAFATIGAACAAANALIVWAPPINFPLHYSTIWIRPGLYAESGIDFPCFCHVIGLGVRGTDTMVEIHPAPGGGAIFVANSMGTHLANLWLEIEDANTPIIDAGVLSSAVIEHCTFRKGADVVGMIGIETDDSHLAEIRHCSFESGVASDLAYGIYCTAGFFHEARVHDNVIFAGVGIYIAGGCTSSQAVIKDNFIEADTIGIDDNNGGSFLINNWIHATNAIDHPVAATRCIANHVLNGAAGAVEAANTD